MKAMGETGNRLMQHWKRKWQSAWPVIGFFLVLFFLVVFRFGITYCLTVSVFTTLFQVRRNRNNTVGTAVFLLGESLVLVALSHLAVQSLFWCVLINALVPLVLVFLGRPNLRQRAILPQP